MTAKGSSPPKYNPKLVERAVLEVVIELDPVCQAVPELSLRIAADPQDLKEVETITHAIRNLRRLGLLRRRKDGRIAPTEAALHAASLLLG